MDFRSNLGGGHFPDVVSSFGRYDLSYAPDMLPLGPKRHCPIDSEIPTDGDSTEEPQKRRRVDNRLANDTYFACPFYQADPLRFGGPKGCAGWCTPEIHRVYTDHLQKHCRDGHVSKESIVEIKEQLKSIKEPLSTELGRKKRWNVVYCCLHGRSSISDLPSPYYIPIQDRSKAVNMRDEDGRTALHRVSASGDAETAKLLITFQASLDIVDNKGYTPLIFASKNGHEGVAQLLLCHGADVHALGGEDGSALQAASTEGRKDIVELLLEHGAEVNVQGGYYGNALQGASASGHKKIVKLLLQRGAEINKQGGLLGNSLQAASVRGHETVVKLLLEKGANVNTQGGLYHNALRAALGNEYEKVAQLLRAHGAQE